MRVFRGHSRYMTSTLEVMNFQKPLIEEWGQATFLDRRRGSRKGWHAAFALNIRVRIIM